MGKYITIKADAVRPVILGVFCAVVVAMFGIYPAYKAMVSNGKIEYCRVVQEFGHNTYSVTGVRYWSDNRTLANNQTLDEAVAFTKLVGCEVK